jgi:hypothetical protein
MRTRLITVVILEDRTGAKPESIIVTRKDMATRDSEQIDLCLAGIWSRLGLYSKPSSITIDLE